MSKHYQAIVFTAAQQAELVEKVDEGELQPNEVAGRTLATLVSPGTELMGQYIGQRFPVSPGYASVFEVEQIGSQVTGIQVGDRLFSMGHHQSYQRIDAANTVPVPVGLPAAWAPFTRLMGVTMATLTTTVARPPALVMVTGLGPVGNLGAQIFQACGYQVIAVDPDERRQASLRQTGVERVYASVPVEDPSVVGKVALQVECSGHEQAVLDGCKVVQKRGEISLVGAPWVKRSEIAAQEILHKVFFNFLTLRSGWEWELALHDTPFRNNSIFGNYAAGLRWLQEGRVKVDTLYELVKPSNAQRVYQDILHRRLETVSVVFDWP